MKTENRPAIINLFTDDLEMVKKLVYDKYGFAVTNPEIDTENAAYGACSFTLNGRTVQYRASKITPAKTGQFVTTWKRSREGITEPFDISDDIILSLSQQEVVTTSGSLFSQKLF